MYFSVWQVYCPHFLLPLGTCVANSLIVGAGDLDTTVFIGFLKRSSISFWAYKCTDINVVIWGVPGKAFIMHCPDLCYCTGFPPLPWSLRVCPLPRSLLTPCDLPKHTPQAAGPPTSQSLQPGGQPSVPKGASCIASTKMKSPLQGICLPATKWIRLSS